MTRTIKFTKMHGLGNDYIYVDTARFPIENPEECSKLWSAPHTGIGSDGLVLIGASEVADFSMRIFNADGSEAMMCGNASRCIGKYLFDYGLTDKTEIRLETLSGIKILKLHIVDGKVETVTVDMGKPAPLNPKGGTAPLNTPKGGTQEVSSKKLEVRSNISLPLGVALPRQTGEPGGGVGGASEGVAVSMGNPHLVVFVDDVAEIDLPAVGPKLENHPLFPDRINVEFAQILGEGKIRMRVWERGSGITQACGTGACATAVAACITGRAGRSSTIIMDGGSLHICWDEATGHVLMTGTATKVFDGEIVISD